MSDDCPEKCPHCGGEFYLEGCGNPKCEIWCESDTLTSNKSTSDNMDYVHKKRADSVDIDSIIEELNSKESEKDLIIDRLRGQLQNCVNHLEGQKRRYHWKSEEIEKAVESANKCLYETLIK